MDKKWVLYYEDDHKNIENIKRLLSDYIPDENFVQASDDKLFWDIAEVLNVEEKLKMYFMIPLNWNGEISFFVKM